MRLRLVPENTSWDFFSRPKLWLGISAALILLSLVSFVLQGLNYGIDFRGGTTIRTESAEPVDVGAYRDALQSLELGDITISEVFDPTFGPDQNVAMVRIQAQEGQESVAVETIELLPEKLKVLFHSLKVACFWSIWQEVLHLFRVQKFVSILQAASLLIIG